MAIKYDKRGRKRDYKKEYRRDQSSTEQKKRRAARNAARRKLKVPNGDPRQVHHKDGNPRNNKRSNLQLVSRSKNTTMSNKKRAKS